MWQSNVLTARRPKRTYDGAPIYGQADACCARRDRGGIRVVALVRTKVAVVPRAAIPPFRRLCAYRDPARVVVSLSRLNRVRALDPLNDTLTAERAACWGSAESRCGFRKNVFRSRSRRGQRQIGGNSRPTLWLQRAGYATPASSTRPEVVLPDADLHCLRCLRKDTPATT